MDTKAVHLFGVESENIFDQVTIRIASPEAIRSWSYGEVKTPETINYRTFKPEKDGLFCEKIFGPTKDWECACGKYKRIKHKGVVCDRCGVEVTLSSVRRERMGVIDLAVPVSHIWFLKSAPSRIGNVLNLSTRLLESVIYYENYIVVNPGKMNLRDKYDYVKTGIKTSGLNGGVSAKQLMTEEEYHSSVSKYDDEFEALIGAEAVQKLLSCGKEMIRDIPPDDGEKETLAALIARDYKKNLKTGGVFKPEELEVLCGEAAKEYLDGLSWSSPRDEVTPEVICQQTVGDKEIGRSAVEYASAYRDYEKLPPKKLAAAQKDLETMKAEYLDVYSSVLAGQMIGALEKLKVPVGEDLDRLASLLKKQLQQTRSIQMKKKLAKRLRIVNNFLISQTRPEWMILDVIPVIPPDLRPLVPLEGGRFATSDLNDLYRRVINRNNRLKSILQLKTPDVIVRNEKRMLQEAVDALFDNGRQGRAVLGAGNRPLKSLSDNLKGKQGRFRQNLLGKRVDYSGRSVIVVGPELKLNQCGLPKEMALELFEPFIIHRLKELGYVHTIRSAKKMIEKQEKQVWDVLDEVIQNHPVLLNRAPTLHRLGIQAFDPILVEGKAIRIHPLVCTAFNADFDGDQMAVHVPLSNEAQLEARLLMYAPNNIFSPASGEPIANPTQDIALGCYYLTRSAPGDETALKPFTDENEVLLALAEKAITLHQPIKIQGITKQLAETDAKGNALPSSEWKDCTTAGRVIFNQIFPPEIPFINQQVGKKDLSEIVARCYAIVGHEETVHVLDRIKDMGFESATWSGLSLGMKDMVQPKDKEDIIRRAGREVAAAQRSYDAGKLTAQENYNRKLDIWSRASRDLSVRVFEDLQADGEPGLNPLYMMMDSGARGSMEQIQQIAGMRGLMAKPSGEIIEYPIISNFRDGLSVLEYFISTHGARKGLADTALKTADSGYLTRRLVDVAQDVIISMEDCGTFKGRRVRSLVEEGDVVIPISERIKGRVSQETVKGRDGKVIVRRGQEITSELAREIEDNGVEEVRIRSILTCEAPEGVCSFCYGRNLANQRMSSLGDAVGIISAQSIGEPGTQLTMRTFHIGGTASIFTRQPEILAGQDGVVRYDQHLETVKGEEGRYLVLKSGGSISLFDSAGKDGREQARYKIEVGSELFATDGEKVKQGKLLVRWDPHSTPILSGSGGRVQYVDIIEGETMKVQRSKNRIERIIQSMTGHELHPQINIVDAKNPDRIREPHLIPSGAIVEVENGAEVEAGARIARTPRKMTKTADITGGLSRVAELFEARRPKDAATIAQISGEVEFGPRKRGKLTLLVKDPKTKRAEEHLIPLGTHIIVHDGEKVQKGQKLTDGPIVLQEMLEVSGMEGLQEYLINEVQKVYSLQGVKINDKHIETIVRQMVSKVQVTDPGDTDFLYDEQVDRFTFFKENERIKAKGLSGTARSKNLLLGITKASLATESFISAASFQETTRILTDAAAGSKVDSLKGFKENVIMGHLIPGGDGLPELKKQRLMARENGEETKEIAE
ncbi:MAG: DNA-directed RNA polymerase subunit beta' [PVC group bacterium]